MKPLQRKRVRHYHQPGDIHELTFSCYKCQSLLTNNLWKSYLSHSINTACKKHLFQIVAFVYMPEHVHLLVNPVSSNCNISGFLAAIKRPTSARIKRVLIQLKSSLLEKLMIRERPGKTTFRFWQEGGGYDRNLHSEPVVLVAIDYIHLNPVRRGLCEQAREWKWSSARFYENAKVAQDDELPEVHGLPADFFINR